MEVRRVLAEVEEKNREMERVREKLADAQVIMALLCRDRNKLVYIVILLTPSFPFFHFVSSPISLFTSFQKFIQQLQSEASTENVQYQELTRSSRQKMSELEVILSRY